MALKPEPRWKNLWQSLSTTMRVFPYLGVTLDKRQVQEVEIKDRLGKTIKLYFDTNSKFIEKNRLKYKPK